MAFRYNPFTGTLDLVGTSGGGTGTIVGPSSSQDRSITRWSGTTGKVINDSKTYLQDGGGIEAQGFISRKIITDQITVKANQSMITTALSIEGGELVIDTDAEVVIL